MLALTGDRDWFFDLDIGLLFFDAKCRWQVQVLGTEAEHARNWLWAWANTGSNIPAHLLQASLTLKAYGEEHGIPELATSQLPLDQIDGHTLALFASGICEANAYYRCPYDGGALFVLIMDENFPEDPTPPLHRLATVLPQAIASLEITDHRLALTGYLDHYGLSFEQVVDKIVVKENGEPVLTATFDGQKRLTNLEAQLDPPAVAEPVADMEPSQRVESWDEAQLRRMLGG